MARPLTKYTSPSFSSPCATLSRLRCFLSDYLPVLLKVALRSILTVPGSLTDETGDRNSSGVHLTTQTRSDAAASHYASMAEEHSLFPQG